MRYDELRGKVAIVTGAGNGLGRAIACAFGEQGAHVVVGDLSAQDAEATASAIRDLGARACAVSVDVSKSEMVEKLVARAAAEFGGVDILVNNAGISLAKKPRMIDITEDDFQLMLSVNLIGAWLGMKWAIPEMLKRGGGVVVNFSSTMGLVAQPGASAYVAAKHGVVGLTKAAAIEYGQSGIRVNAICPGRHATPAVVAWQGSMDNDEWDEQVKRLHPATGRVGQPEEIAATVLFLCSDGASNIHGVALPVDGGWTAQ